MSPDPELPEPYLWPCGCFISFRPIEGRRTALFSPCSVDCPTAIVVVTMMVETGKPVDFRAEP